MNSLSAVLLCMAVRVRARSASSSAATFKTPNEGIYREVNLHLYTYYKDFTFSICFLISHSI